MQVIGLLAAGEITPRTASTTSRALPQRLAAQPAFSSMRRASGALICVSSTTETGVAACPGCRSAAALSRDRRVRCL